MATSIHHNRWTDDNPTGRPLHIVRHCWRRPGDGFAAHDHDFAEVFWCESGDGVHTVAGVDQPLAAGDLVFVRPDDVHAGRAGRAGMTIVNVSFAPRAVAALARLHAGDWPWRPGPPQRVRLDARRLERLSAWAQDLGGGATRAIDRDSFVLDLVRLVSAPAGDDRAVGLPPWLREALEIFADPRHLPGGVPTLARLAGRGVDHLNRVVRAAQRRTATELVTVVRLDAAASALRMGDRPISSIAADVGLANLGHFYRLFNQRFGATPRRYRLAAWQRSGPVR